MKTLHQVQLASTDGLGGGTTNFNGDYSITEAKGKIQAPTGHSMQIYRMLGLIEDTAGMDADDYGNLGSALTNGIKFEVHSDNESIVDNFTNGHPIKDNASWGLLCYDVDVKTWGSGNEMLLLRFTFGKFGGPIHLENDEHVCMYFNDDFTGLVRHNFIFEGTVSGL